MSALRFLYKKTLKRRDIAYDDLAFPKTPRPRTPGASGFLLTPLSKAPRHYAESLRFTSFTPGHFR